MFNPLIRKFRIHWFSVRPCFDLLSPQSLLPLARDSLNAEQYYKIDLTGPHFRVIRLGKRSQEYRAVEIDGIRFLFGPHGFWQQYMTKVAGHQYRGPWYGLAPMRFQIPDYSQERVLRLQPEFRNDIQQTVPDITTVSAFPN